MDLLRKERPVAITIAYKEASNAKAAPCVMRLELFLMMLDRCRNGCPPLTIDPENPPAYHAELQMAVPCGGRHCPWMPLATRVDRDTQTPCKHNPPKSTHVLCVAYCQDSYAVRVTLDRRFDTAREKESYRSAVVSVTVADAARVAKFVVDTIRWSHRHTNAIYNEHVDRVMQSGVNLSDARRVPEALMETYVERVDEHFEEIEEIQQSERTCKCGFLSRLGDAFGSLCDNGWKTYNEQGYYCNQTVSCVASASSSRGDFVDDSNPGAPVYYEPVPRPMICSEFVAAALQLTEYSVYFPLDPGFYTPYAIVNTLRLLPTVTVSSPLTASTVD